MIVAFHGGGGILIVRPVAGSTLSTCSACWERHGGLDLGAAAFFGGGAAVAPFAGGGGVMGAMPGGMIFFFFPTKHQ